MPTMPVAETLLRMTSADLSLVGAAVSVLSFLVALRLAWTTKFSPPRLIGVFPYVVLYTFTKSDDKPSDLFLVPAFWLTNTGARPMLAEEIRLVIAVSADTVLTLYPVHTVPLEAIDAPNTFEDYELLRLGKAPFSGLAVSPSERWMNNLAFSLTSDERKSLRENASVSLEVRSVGSKRFKRVLQQRIVFGHSVFSWLNWVGLGGPLAEYFYAQNRQQTS